MRKKADESVQLFSFVDDVPKDGRGSLIPSVPKGRRQQPRFTPDMAAATVVTKTSGGVVITRFLLVAVVMLAFVATGVVGYGMADTPQLAAAPTISLVDPYTKEATALQYGPQVALTKKTFFTETRDAFVESGFTFVEVDMTQRQLRYFENGVLYHSAQLTAVGESGSWWETPSGLYKVEDKSEAEFSNIGQVYLPWQLSFEGNFVIHGWPTYPDGSAVPAGLAVGGIRVSDESAEALYNSVGVGTPVLVHAAPKAVNEFVYQLEVPDINAQYLVADIETGTVLAASTLDKRAPIASVTKLMTAVVAAEELNLDGRIQVTTPTFVQSLIPRLSERSSVSMYSLLQLLLVESSNEAAETIAGELGRTEFIEAMNAKARQLGMLDTSFADPSGLSSENVSTLGDLYTLTKYIRENRQFIFDITARKELNNAQVGGDFGGLVNFNEIDKLDNFVGGKIGETIAAKQTSISLHRVDFQSEERVIAVILLGSEQRSADIRSLLSFIQNRYDN